MRAAASRKSRSADRWGRAVLDRLLSAIGEEAGVAAVGAITNIPLSGNGGKVAIKPEGYVPPPGQSLHGHYAYGATGDYFSAIGIPLRAGRFLTTSSPLWAWSGQ